MEEMGFKTVWFICHYAQQPPYNTMLRYHNWGKQLVKRGCNVTVVAASSVHNTETDVIEKIGKQESVCEGVQYYYVKTPRYTGNGLRRIKNMLYFCFGLTAFTKKTTQPDVVITCEAYLFPFVKRVFKDVPIVTDTVDLWPVSIIEYANYSKSNPIILALYKLEKSAYIKSDALIFSIEGGMDYLQEQKYFSKIDRNKVYHINMGCDIEEADKNSRAINEPLPWDQDKFNLVYCGSIRQANQVRLLCEAAGELEKRGLDDVVLHIYGNGDELESLKEYVKKNHINNVHFYGRIEKAKIPYILSNAKANIFTYKQVNLMKYGGSQSKLFDYLASGRPIICNAMIGYNLITRYTCGLVTENQTMEDFVDTVEQLHSMTNEQLDEMGRNSRRVAETYDLSLMVDQLCNVINYVIKRLHPTRIEEKK